MTTSGSESSRRPSGKTSAAGGAALLSRLKPAPELRPYLTYSLGLHFALAAVLAGAMRWTGGSKAAAVYTIDFVGGPTTVTSGSASVGAAPKAADLAPPTAVDRTPQRDVDEFGRKRRKGPFVLPRPSLLRGSPEKAPEPAKSDAPPSAQASGQASSGAGAAGGSGAGDAGVSADMPNFPYPWYITQVRQALWNLWSSRMPRFAGETVIVFSILPNGSIVDLRTEVSSGDGAFDLTALGAVQDAAPFPRLPTGFAEPFLKIHVTLKSGG